jgi:K+-transporting ATPase KdpF subunit
MRADDGREVMNILYLIAGIVVLVLFIYLALALLNPERFG